MHSTEQLPVNKVVGLVKSGEAVACPRCGARIQPVPEDWVQGTPLSMIKCPINEDHYAVLIEDADAMHRIRDVIRGFSRK